MKRLWAFLVCVMFFSGCGGNGAEMEAVLSMRSRLLGAAGCSFEALITADYGKDIFTFSLLCTADGKGNLQFSVKEPQSISGICGTIDTDGGKLTFDDQALAFELLADGQLSPVSGPWLLIKTLRGGYIRSCGMDGDLLLASIDDSYADDALHLDVWLDAEQMPAAAEVLWRNRRILSMEVKNFQLL